MDEVIIDLRIASEEVIEILREITHHTQFCPSRRENPMPCQCVKGVADRAILRLQAE